MNPFSDPAAAARYAEGPARNVPGHAALLRMAGIVIAERAPPGAHLLVVGAGGGLEMKAFAQAHEDWTFLGVDPSGPMLELAERIMGPLASRATLFPGYIDAAPAGPFDAATCLLTLHFLSRDVRRRTLNEIRRRLSPGAPFIVAHHSIVQDRQGRDLWLSRHAAFAAETAPDPVKAEAMRAAMNAQLTILSPAEDEALLNEAGFSDVSLFYAGFTFRGWIAYA